MGDYQLPPDIADSFNALSRRVAALEGGTRARGGLDYLASSGALATNAGTTGVVQIAARDLLVIAVRVAGYTGGGDTASLRFNGDTGANYTYKYASAAGSVLQWTVAAASTSQSLARLFAANQNTGRSALATITNRSGTEKAGVVSGLSPQGSAGTGPTIENGGFTWVNTSAQITSVEMLTAGGQNMLAGSGFVVFGRNL